jgi:hypothetical protein
MRLAPIVKPYGGEASKRASHARASNRRHAWAAIDGSSNGPSPGYTDFVDCSSGMSATQRFIKAS